MCCQEVQETPDRQVCYQEVQEHTKPVGVLSGGTGAHQTGRHVVRRCRNTPDRQVCCQEVQEHTKQVDML